MRITAGFVFIIVFAYFSAYSQPGGETLTAEERQAVKAFGERFESRLDETGDITPLIAELFVADHVQRFLKEARSHLEVETVKSTTFVSGIEYEPKLIETATQEDWRQLYIETFNFMHHTTAALMNAMADSMLSGKEAEDEDLEKGFSAAHPASVKKLFDEHPILRNFIQMKERRPIRTPTELANVGATLKEANRLVRKEIGAGAAKLTHSSRKLLKTFQEKSDRTYGPRLVVAPRNTYGFDPGTRLIIFFSGPMHQLTITRFGNEYKIVDARISSPD